MKTIRKHKTLLSIFLTINMVLINFASNSITPLPWPPPPPPASSSIKMALLLDTSGSMNGLLEQAKSQLWKIVNELALATKEGQQAEVEFALYQYGNDGLTSESGYIENVLPLSNDLDELSEKLFALTTNGGSEYCGYAIETASNELAWEDDLNALNLIFIAGNEPFNQGPKDFNKTCQTAFEKGITINTIFCGDAQQGVNTQWKKGAEITEGNYMNIDMNQKTVYVETPYDDKIEILNDSLNTTYIPFGKKGKTKKANQIVQDNNSAVYSQQNMVLRTISKSSHVYDNKSWDLVDASKEENFDLEKINEKTLPQEMQKMTYGQKQKHIEKMKTKREDFQKQIKELSSKRTSYIATTSSSQEGSLDAAMIAAIRKQAKDKGFNFTDNIIKAEILDDIELYNKTPYVNYEFFENLVKEVKPYRAERLIEFDQFLEMGKDKNTLILDARSREKYNELHIKGAINLPFAEFTQQSLDALIPSPETRILIYCNNNFAQDNSAFEIAMTSKYVSPSSLGKKDNSSKEEGLLMPKSDLSLALNIPTFINLYGYGYKNVYELEEMLYGTNEKLELEGSFANSPKIKNLKPFFQVMSDTTKSGKPRALVNYDYFEKVIADVKPVRAKRLISFDQFNKLKKEKNTIIIDARSKKMYDKLHIKGAIHLEFSDLTQQKLAEVIPNTNTKILIYCNNNFAQDNQIFREDFASKVARPANSSSSISIPSPIMGDFNSLALNIPNYINLYGYGYQNVYELNELVYAKNPDLKFEGTDAKKVLKN